MNMKGRTFNAYRDTRVIEPSGELNRFGNSSKSHDFSHDLQKKSFKVEYFPNTDRCNRAGHGSQPLPFLTSFGGPSWMTLPSLRMITRSKYR